MDIKLALELTGKAITPWGRVAYEDDFHILRWCDEGTLVMLTNICGADWQPYPEKPEIRPDENVEKVVIEGLTYTNYSGLSSLEKSLADMNRFWDSLKGKPPFKMTLEWKKD